MTIITRCPLLHLRLQRWWRKYCPTGIILHVTGNVLQPAGPSFCSTMKTELQPHHIRPCSFKIAFNPTTRYTKTETTEAVYCVGNVTSGKSHLELNPNSFSFDSHQPSSNKSTKEVKKEEYVSAALYYFEAYISCWNWLKWRDNSRIIPVLVICKCECKMRKMRLL